LQNTTLAMMYARAPEACHDAVSAIRNAPWDGGLGAGAAAIGLLAATTGYHAVFVINAGLIRPALIPARRERSRAATPGRRAGGRHHHADGRTNRKESPCASRPAWA
jgi:predicted MFS family arabinose efflux permease